MSGLADEERPAEEPEQAQEEQAPAEEAGAAPPSLDELMETIRQAKVGQLILSTVSTLASVAYGKLELPDLPEAKVAIDAIGALLPLLEGQVDDGIRRDFEQALTNLRLAYADAVASSG